MKTLEEVRGAERLSSNKETLEYLLRLYELTRQWIKKWEGKGD